MDQMLERNQLWLFMVGDWLLRLRKSLNPLTKIGVKTKPQQLLSEVLWKKRNFFLRYFENFFLTGFHFSVYLIFKSIWKFNETSDRFFSVKSWRTPNKCDLVIGVKIEVILWCTVTECIRITTGWTTLNHPENF